MPHFTKRIHSSLGDYNYYFNRIYTATGMRYHVSVIDKDKKVHMCLMEKKEGIWQLLDPEKCEELFILVEQELQKAIIQHLQDFTEK